MFFPDKRKQLQKLFLFFFPPLEIQHPSCISPPPLIFHLFPPHISHIHIHTQTNTQSNSNNSGEELTASKMLLTWFGTWFTLRYKKSELFWVGFPNQLSCFLRKRTLYCWKDDILTTEELHFPACTAGRGGQWAVSGSWCTGLARNTV